MRDGAATVGDFKCCAVISACPEVGVNFFRLGHSPLSPGLVRNDFHTTYGQVRTAQEDPVGRATARSMRRRLEELLPVLGKRIKGGEEHFLSGRLLSNNAFQDEHKTQLAPE